VTCAKSNGIYNYGAFYVTFRHHFKEEAPKDNLLYKADIYHSQNMKDYLSRSVINIKTIPQINAYNNNQRSKV
jgi:hypothetical protein